MSTPTDNEMVDQIIEAVDDDQYELTKWEENFMMAMVFLTSAGHPLSSKQDDALESIWRKAVRD